VRLTETESHGTVTEEESQVYPLAADDPRAAVLAGEMIRPHQCLDNAWGHINIAAVDKPWPVNNSGRRTMFTAAESDKYAGDRRLSALCRVALPFHRITVTCSRSPLITGVIATAWDTNPLRQ
jgi:hypothetical protein